MVKDVFQVVVEFFKAVIDGFRWFQVVTILDMLQKANSCKARFRTSIGKTTLSTLAVDHWQKTATSH